MEAFLDGQLVKKVCSTFTRSRFKTTSSPVDGLSIPVQIIKARRRVEVGWRGKWSRELENRDEESASEYSSR